jgi:hypothetical protein
LIEYRGLLQEHYNINKLDVLKGSDKGLRHLPPSLLDSGQQFEPLCPSTAPSDHPKQRWTLLPWCR